MIFEIMYVSNLWNGTLSNRPKTNKRWNRSWGAPPASGCSQMGDLLFLNRWAIAQDRLQLDREPSANKIAPTCHLLDVSQSRSTTSISSKVVLGESWWIYVSSAMFPFKCVGYPFRLQRLHYSYHPAGITAITKGFPLGSSTYPVYRYSRYSNLPRSSDYSHPMGTSSERRW
jgi:hypothetical protein